MKVSKTAIFLFELMFVILIFTVSAAICTNIFAKAHSFSTDSKALTMGVLKAESVAEEFKADITAGKDAAAGEQYYDRNWKETSQKKAYYTVNLTGVDAPEFADGLHKAEVLVVQTGRNSDKQIYSLEVSAYGGK
jgi:hypothetical protein